MRAISAAPSRQSAARLMLPSPPAATSRPARPLAGPPELLATALVRVRAYVRSLVSQPADAEDIVQESMARTIRRAQEIDIARPDHFALSVARNLLIDRGRAKGLGHHDALEDTLVCPAPLPDQHLAEKQRFEIFQRTLDAMPPLRREIFVRRRIEGQSREEIAAATGLNAEAVKKHVTRALAQLAMALDQAEAEAGDRS